MNRTWSKPLAGACADICSITQISPTRLGNKQIIAGFTGWDQSITLPPNILNTSNFIQLNEFHVNLKADYQHLRAWREHEKQLCLSVTYCFEARHQRHCIMDFPFANWICHSFSSL